MDRGSSLRILAVIAASAAAVALTASGAIADDGDTLWDPDGVDVWSQSMTTDGNGGAIFAWTSGISLHMQRIDANGNTVWGPTTVEPANVEGHRVAVASDGSGGAIVAWIRNDPVYRVMVRAIDANGLPKYSAVVVASAGTTTRPSIATDGAGGAYIGFDSKVARVGAGGTLVEIVDLGSGAQAGNIVADGEGNVIAAWMTPDLAANVVAQKVGPNLDLPWGSDPAVVSDDSSYYNDQVDVASDGSGGALITWRAKSIELNNTQVRVQRLTRWGAPVWASNGVVTVNSNVVGGSQSTWRQYPVYPVACDDGSGGAIVAWGDWRNEPGAGGNDDIYVQRVGPTGLPVWTANGVRPYNYTSGSQRYPKIVSDRHRGAIITYQEMTTNWGITAARMDAAGARVWLRYIIDDSSPQTEPKILFDGSGPEPVGAIICWLPYGAQKVQIGDGQHSRIYVSTTGSNSNSGDSWATAKRIIQNAIDSSLSWTEIWVAKGTYSERITLKKDCWLYGGFAGNETELAQRPPFPRAHPDPNDTIIDADYLGRAITCQAGATRTTVIDGFTIIDGQADYGGGISCVDSSPTIRNNWIENCGADEGGAIYCARSGAQITHNVIASNGAGMHGGGIRCSDGVLLYIDHNLIVSNTANLGDGGGISCVNGEYYIHHNTLSGNVAGAAGGSIRCWESNVYILNNIVAFSTASYGGGIHCHISNGNICSNTITGNIASTFGGGIDCHDSMPNIYNNIIAFNTGGIFGGGTYLPTPDYNDVHGNLLYQYFAVTPGSHDIDADPLFVDFWTQNFHLAHNSPCINKGLTTGPGVLLHDIDGQNRILESIIDMGADERVSEAAQLTSVSGAKKLPNCTLVQITGKPVTARFGDVFYIENEDRCAGIRVANADFLVDRGKLATVMGPIRTNDDGERFIDAEWGLSAGSGEVEPVIMNISALGGGDWFYDSDNGAGQAGVLFGSGLNNIGLLVKVSGQVSASSLCEFYIRDGTCVESFGSFGSLNVRVALPDGVVSPPPYVMVTVTGISSCEKVGRSIYRLIRVRDQDDIKIW